MTFGSALPLHERAQYAEGTALASSRDSRNNSLQWKQNQKTAKQTVATVDQLRRVSREVSKMRRRIVGGGGGGSGVSQSGWRGLWTGTPDTPYMIGDMVVVGAGTSSGCYVSNIDNNPNLPDTGIGWTQFSSYATWL